MANNLWTAFIAKNGSNNILVASSQYGSTWTPSVPIYQKSPFTPALAFFKGGLYVAFITDDIDSATGVPSNRIFLCSTTNGLSWSSATFFNQYSKCAPSLAVWNNSLYIAFVENDPSNTLLVYHSQKPDNASSWSATVPTNQTSANAPSLAGCGQTGKLYLAFVAENGSQDILVCSLTPGQAWSAGPPTGQSCHFSPSLAGGETLYFAFATANGGRSLLLCTLNPNGTWSDAVLMNQSTSATPSLTAFGSGLSVGFIANDLGAQVLIATTSNPSSWTSGDVYTQQQSAEGPSIAVAPFACNYQRVPLGTLRGFDNYIWASAALTANDIPTLTGIQVKLQITGDEDLVFDDNGFSVQVNCCSPPEPPSQVASDPDTAQYPATLNETALATTGSNWWDEWQQYLIVATGGVINFQIQIWPMQDPTTAGVAGNLAYGETLLAQPNGSAAIGTYKNNTIPAGTTITLNLVYQGAVVTGMSGFLEPPQPGSVQTTTLIGCTFKQHNSTYPYQIDSKFVERHMAPIGAFQVLVTGAPSALATFSSSAGQITVTCDQSQQVLNYWPTPYNGATAENSNMCYGSMPPSPVSVQPFSVSSFVRNGE